MAVQTRREGDLFQVDFSFDPRQYDGEIVSIGLAGEFLFYRSNLTGSTDQTGMMDNTEKFPPVRYQPGMAPIGGRYYQDMLFNADQGVYQASLNLPAGLYNYHFLINAELIEPVTGPMAWSNVQTADGQIHGLKFSFDQWLADPDNKPPLPTPTGLQRSSSLALGTAADFIWLADEKTTGRGTVTFLSYSDIDGQTQHIGVYLPAGYDRQSAQPYQLILVSHGGGGNENDWYAQGNINVIMDNLIAQGRTQKAILVTMNNGVYKDPETHWDFSKISENIAKCVLPHVEKLFNISPKVEDRAFCGLSMGGMTTSYLYMHHTDWFGCYGIFSGAIAGGKNFTLESPDLTAACLMVGCGEEDMAYNSTDIGLIKFQNELRAKGIDFTPYFVTGAHDWFAWPRLFAFFAEHVLWQYD